MTYLNLNQASKIYDNASFAILNTFHKTKEIIFKIKHIVLEIFKKIKTYDFSNFFQKPIEVTINHVSNSNAKQELLENVNTSSAVSETLIKIEEFETPRELLEKDLNDWVKAKPDESREIAKNRILRSYDAQDQELDLSKLALTSLPPCIQALTYLKKIDLSSNKLEILPPEIGNLVNLTKLRLDFNQLKTLPTEIRNLVNLTKLDLSYNQLEAPPPEIGNLSNLTKLDLSHNQLKTLPPEIGNLSNLTKLDLSHNQLKTLPPEIGNLANLTELRLHNNQLKTLPLEIHNLANLTELHLDNNQLKTLPLEIHNLANLTELHLDNNQLKTLPPEIGNLVNLQGLFLNGNQLKALSPEIGNLANLKELYLDNNKMLNGLPLALGQISTLLIIDYNQTSIPENDARAILQSCRALRAENSGSTLLITLQKWFTLAKIKLNKNFFEALDIKNKAIFNEWLSRLELAADFKHNQRKLATLACQMASSLTDPKFNELFFVQADANNENCGDRAAMAFNVAHTTWILVTQLADAPPKERLNLMLACARTTALRTAIGKAIKRQNAPDGENTETYLYYETLLRKRLELVSPIETTLDYATNIGKRDWIKEEELVNEVYETYMDELMKFPIFDKFTEEEPTFKARWDACKDEYVVKVENLSHQAPDAPIESDAYLNWQHAMGQLMRERTKAFQNIVEDFMNAP